ncbi:AbrB family transcriptional regulator [Alicyclobacillus contaminans]|uniref:AbrB/MazE/SpoVT family DNA-binding domain-containing protein n=1 Tax=Alicyclobacillus contaminans TaxID=392016 RepID=UPI000410B0C4|nr:AbrB/MazE/SpoVT family DNA-binding domain-containing protein [Alicyclobacillus contaminans]GMA49350.1 AbrB family transcriptional regulator [Alicyclobacillus contaminans]
MKATGVVRHIDDLGRVVIPKELRRTMGLKEGDPMEFFVDDNGRIVMQKYQPGCVFCDSMEDLIFFNGRNVCKACIYALGQ